jgi:hypothetical protein
MSISNIENILEENEIVSTKISEQFTELNKRTESFEDMIKSLSIQLPANTIMMEKANSLVQSYDQQLAVIQTATEQMNKLKLEMKSYADSAEMKGLQAKVDTVEKTVTTSDAKVQALGLQHTALQTAVKQLETANTSLQGIHTDLNTKISAIQTELKTQTITPEQKTAMENVTQISKLLGIDQTAQTEILANSALSLYKRIISIETQLTGILPTINTTLANYNTSIQNLLIAIMTQRFDPSEGTVVTYTTKAPLSAFGAPLTPDSNGSRDITVVATGVICSTFVDAGQKFAKLRWDRIVSMIHPVWSPFKTDDYLTLTTSWKNPWSVSSKMLNEDETAISKHQLVPHHQVFDRPNLHSLYFNADGTRTNNTEAQIRSEVWRSLAYFGTCGIGPSTFRDLPGVLPTSVLTPIGKAVVVATMPSGRKLYDINNFEPYNK